MTQQFPKHFTIFLLQTLRTTTISGVLSLLLALGSGVKSITETKGIPKLFTLLVGLSSAYTARDLLLKRQHLQDVAYDMDLVSRKQNISWWVENLKPATLTATLEYSQQWVIDNLVPDLLEYQHKQDKHFLLIGGTGDGKSTLIQAIAQRWAGEVSVYDVDYAKGDWGFIDSGNITYEPEEIAAQMELDLEELEKRIDQRREVGKHKYSAMLEEGDIKRRLIIAEEMPALANQFDIVADWIRGMAKRGRKPGLFIAALAQNDTVENLGVSGDKDIINSCFVRVYLGSKARERAKQLKNNALLEWLKELPRGRFLVDDRPCEWLITSSSTNTLPSLPPSAPLHDSLQAQHNLIGVESLRSTAQTGFEVNEVAFEGSISARKTAILLAQAGYSKSAIVRELWGVTGGASYSRYMGQVKEWLE
ncbi:hypothetical protein BZZ01_13490 [Nostocales cyanobacterium HT-58-2]|nr:hypothetical protein BZZ01_13490 [Nostocales cyanobacterium HT-58-2]